MRFAANDADDLLELSLDDERPDGTEVSFGRGRGGPRRARGRRLGAVVVAGALLVGGSIALGRHHAGKAPSSAKVPATLVPPVPRRSGAPSPGYVPLPQFANPVGWRLYVRSTDTGRVWRFDPTTGAVEPFGPDASGIGRIVAGREGPVALPSGNSPGAMLPVGDGTGWFVDGGDLVRGPVGGGPESERSQVPSSGPIELVGVTAEGRPIVAQPDARDYVFGADGSLTRFVDETVAFPVTDGQYVGTRCDPHAACTTMAHTKAGTMTMLVNGLPTDVSFSPDGRYVAALMSARSTWSIHLWRVGVGEFYNTWNVATDGVDPIGAWSPDGRFFVFSNDPELKVLDTATDEVYTLPVPWVGSRVVIGLA